MQEDNYYPHGRVQKFMWDGFYKICEPLLKTWPFKKIRDNAIQFTIDQIHYEDENSRYITIGCVEKVRSVCEIFIHECVSLCVCVCCGCCLILVI